MSADGYYEEWASTYDEETGCTTEDRSDGSKNIWCNDGSSTWIGSDGSEHRSFYDEELAFRREQADPPFGRLIRLLYSHTNQAICERDARKLGASVRRSMEESGASDTDVLGPTPAYPPRLRGHYRWHIVLRGPNPRAVLDKLTIPQGWTIDVDPVALT